MTIQKDQKPFYDCKGSPATRGDNCPFIKFVNPLALIEKNNSKKK
ncbi:MAG TPA: hypothetical protein VJZ17_00515 [Nitrosopumilaceae archaeon]|nr:hypothetical protein [Nitrosopumilaceae archaeon]